MVLRVDKIGCAVFPLFLVMLPGACSVADHPASSLKVVNGKVISVTEYPEVVLLGTEEGKLLCSGTFITPSIVLTAAHCTKKSEQVDPATHQIRDLTLTILRQDNPAAMTYSIAAVSLAAYRSPRWDNEFPLHLLNKYDIAAIRFPADTSAYVHEISHVKPQAGDPFVIVGYGIDYVPGRFDFTIDRSSAGIKRMGTNTVRAVADGMISFYGPTRTTETDGVHSGSSKGDSGGPMFVNNRLVGVTSGGRFDSLSDDRRTTYYTDVTSDDSTDFLRQVLEEE